MSIVICVIDKNQTLYIASDKRAIKNNTVTDDFHKIYELDQNIYFAMTGIAEYGLVILNKIEDFMKKGITGSGNIIAITDSIFSPSKYMLTIMIAGKNENGFFIWQKNNTGETKNIVGSSTDINFSINSNSNINKYNEILKSKISVAWDIETAIEMTIVYASEIDSSISPEYNILKI